MILPYRANPFRMQFSERTGSHDSEELPMQTVTTIGLDIAKSVFQGPGGADCFPERSAPYDVQAMPRLIDLCRDREIRSPHVLYLRAAALTL
jgi:hypothetical protein